jgi:hypothetical protein
MFAVLNIVLMVLIGQIPELITGIPAIGYAFNIFYAITGSIALLMYEGRRWRIFTQSLLFNSLAIFLVRIYTPIAAVVSILASFIMDVVFNSFYESFRKRNKLLWWGILSQVYSHTTQPVWTLLFVSVFLAPFEAVLSTWFFPVICMVLPVIIIEAIAGGYLGYKTYLRVEKLA